MKKSKLHCMAPAVLSSSACFFASVKYGSIITEIKGKVGGQTYQGGTQGPVIRNSSKLTKADAGRSSKLTKADAGRTIQNRANFAQTSSAWRDLSDENRASWVAGAVNFPFKNKFGETYTGSGYQVFMSVNTSLANINFSQRDDCPAPISLLATREFTVTYADTVNPSYTFDGVIHADYSAILYACVNQSAGKQLTPGRLKAIRVFPAATYVAEDITDDYTNVFGIVPTEGTVWFQLVMVSNITGQLCIPYTALATYP